MKTWTPLVEVGDFSPVGFSVFEVGVTTPSATHQLHGQILEHRVAVLWDEDRDERILSFLAHVYFCAPSTLARISAIAERKGSVTVWAAGTDDEDWKALSRAASGDHIQDSWPLEVRALWFLDNDKTDLNEAFAVSSTGAQLSPKIASDQEFSLQDELISRAGPLVGLGWWSRKREWRGGLPGTASK